MIAWIALCLAGIAAFFSWRLSRPVSAALWLAFGSTCAYVLAMEYFPAAHARGAFEAQRLVSLVVGSAGVYELISRAEARRVISGKRYADARAFGIRSGVLSAECIERARYSLALSRLDVIALLCIASAAVDGVAWLGFPYGLAWSQPWIQSAVCVAIVGLCEWPRKEGAT